MDDYLEMAASETNRLELLIARVMNVSDSNGEAYLPSLETVDINALIQDVLQSMKPRIESENAIVDLHIPEERIILKLDRLHIQGVIMNLIDNSLKYSKQAAEIEIELIREPEIVRVTVSDRGIDIPPEYRARIFENFFRVPTGDLHNVKGYGLGLSYADMVMKQHAGRILYHPRPGGGSIFELIFPNAVA